MKNKILKSLDVAAQALFDKKGTNIIALDVRGISSVTDYYIIAEGTIERHVLALANYVEEELEKAGEHPFHIEGKQDGGWVVLDYVDFVIHLCTFEVREKYALEELWKDAEIVDLQIALEPKESSV